MSKAERFLIARNKGRSRSRAYRLNLSRSALRIVQRSGRSDQPF
ncbi:hypothetical protein SS05631_c32130 [Sinorhizobium sp. CCBAU 05631]|nr:hypothetical protein SS05631_c32130 [Sinorhizobium sp. CCBAU 05631]